MERNRIFFLALLLMCGIVLAFTGNYLMDLEKPVRQGSSLLENYLIMQSMAGKNASYLNQSFLIGDSGIVVSFNELLSIRESPVPKPQAVVNATAPLTLQPQRPNNIDAT